MVEFNASGLGVTLRHRFCVRCRWWYEDYGDGPVFNPNEKHPCEDCFQPTHFEGDASDGRDVLLQG